MNDYIKILAVAITVSASLLSGIALVFGTVTCAATPPLICKTSFKALGLVFVASGILTTRMVMEQNG